MNPGPGGAGLPGAATSGPAVPATAAALAAPAAVTALALAPLCQDLRSFGGLSAGAGDWSQAGSPVNGSIGGLHAIGPR
ncbi:MAG: hypothetical protein ABSF33_04600, partial [Acidimicrobiales bacterium]